MSKDERRKALDPIWWHQVRARLARIKVATATRRVESLQANVLETTLLRARLEGGKDRGHTQRRD